MKNNINVLLWIKNIAHVCTAASICWLGAKLVRVLTIFNTGGGAVLGKTEWDKMKSFSTLDKTMIIILIISIIVIIITNKIRRKTKWFSTELLR